MGRPRKQPVREQHQEITTLSIETKARFRLFGVNLVAKTHHYCTKSTNQVNFNRHKCRFTLYSSFSCKSCIAVTGPCLLNGSMAVRLMGVPKTKS